MASVTRTVSQNYLRSLATQSMTVTLLLEDKDNWDVRGLSATDPELRICVRTKLNDVDTLSEMRLVKFPHLSVPRD